MKKDDFARVYGSPERVEWTKASPCVICGLGPCENAHVGSGGMGRKADCSAIVPLCAPRGQWQGHHAEHHRIGTGGMNTKYGTALGELAKAHDRTWKALAKRKARG